MSTKISRKTGSRFGGAWWLAAALVAVAGFGPVRDAPAGPAASDRVQVLAASDSAPGTKSGEGPNGEPVSS